MSRWLQCSAVLLASLLCCAACSGRHSPSGFRLPPGDMAAGQKAFVDLECTTCHTVRDVSLPAPTAPTPVVLGGLKALAPTDGDLTTDIIMPSSHFAEGYAADQIQQGATSKMPDHTRRMTVKQLADLIAFLQSHYRSGLGS